MESVTMACFESLQHDVSKLPNDEARACLTNFIEICGALYTAEAENDIATQNHVHICRDRILEIHQKSVCLLNALLNSVSPHKQCTIDAVFKKLRELNNISENIDITFGKVQSYRKDVERSYGNDQSISGDMTQQDYVQAKARVKDIVMELNGLARFDQSLQKEEQEALTVKRNLSQRLEVLKQKTNSHPAIKAYTARNQRSPQAVRGRCDEYEHYAAAMNRVLNKIKKATEQFKAASKNDVAGIKKQLPLLRTLSHTLGRLHVTTLEESSTSSEQMENPDSPIHDCVKAPPAQRMQNSRSLISGKDMDRRMAETLTRALASIGSMRRMVDASLGQVTGMLSESSGERGNSTTTAAPWPSSVTNNCGDVSHSPSCPSGANDVLDAKPFKFMFGDEKKCREQLIDGTEILSSAIEDLLRIVEVRCVEIKSQAVLNSALCRPFPQTSILRLDLIRLLMAQDDLPVVPQSPKVTDTKKPLKSKRPRKAEKSSSRKSTESKYDVEKKSRVTKKPDPRLKNRNKK